ncbi:hypothetical protein [uncultured Helicobacter sp.]|uniref:hypothetical protein n=1 Tax=uncultured Helicobacter sp. TaxID=175537 RepID=UPI00375316CB
MLVEAPSAKAAPTWSNHCADKSSDLSKDSKIPSTSANDIIPQTQNNVSESAIARMKQKIEQVAKNGFQKSEHKQDKGKTRTR